MEKYGKTEAEADAEKLIECRHIVLEILNFGITETQKRQIIKLLACELESVRVQVVTRNSGPKTRFQTLIANNNYHFESVRLAA